MPECVSCCFYAEIRTGRGRAAADSAPGGSGGKRGEMRAGPVQSVVPAVGPAVGSLVVCLGGRCWTNEWSELGGCGAAVGSIPPARGDVIIRS